MLCKNCQSSLTETSKFCNICGAKVIGSRLTLKKLLAHLSEEFLNYDNKFLQTFIYLFKAPELVIDGYINGIRKRYVNPVNYFAIAVTLIGLQIFVINTYFPEGLDLSAISFKGDEEFTNAWMATVMDYQSILFMFNVPIYALMAFLVFFSLKKYNYTEYLVFFLYTVPLLTFAIFLPQLVAMAFGITLGEISYISLIAQIVYTGYCFKRIFKLSISGIVLRTLLFFVVTFIFLILFSIVFIVIIELTVGLDEFIEAQKALQNS